MLARKGTQLALAKKHGWGGKRPGSGRKRKDGRVLPAGVSHLRRAKLDARHPVGITLKVRSEVWSLRGRRVSREVLRALELSRLRADFRLVHFSILGNHLHLIVEAENRASLSRGVQALEIRIARRLNQAMKRSGKVFADRFHAHVLRTPTEVARARRYVLENLAIHLARAGEPARVDELSSEVRPYCVATPGTWLLRIGFHRAKGRLSGAKASFRDD